MAIAEEIYARSLEEVDSLDRREVLLRECIDKLDEDQAFLRALVHVQLGQCAEERGNLKQAQNEYQTSLEAFPRCAEGHLQLAKVTRTLATSQAMLEVVEAHLRSAIEIEEELKKQKSQSSVSRILESRRTHEINCGHEAASALIFLLCQEGRDAEAATLLRSRGLSHRLSKSVLNYQPPMKGPWQNDIPYTKAINNALPDNMLRHMQLCFKQESSFWTEHNYSPFSPYFSYLHPLNKSTATNSLDQIIAYLHRITVQLFPQAKDAQFAEWWAHCRPHSHGHQLHFDSDDEGRARVGGKPRHPIVSSVLYLTENIGGPTLVTNQRLGGLLADQGWFVFPQVNRFTVFDGSVLHGVIPGKSWHSQPDERRITFMIAFWKDIQAQPSPTEAPGSSRPFPEQGKTRFSWPKLFEPQTNFDTAQPPTELHFVCPIPVGSVWEESNPAKRKAGDSKPQYLPRYEACFQGF